MGFIENVNRSAEVLTPENIALLQQVDEVPALVASAEAASSTAENYAIDAGASATSAVAASISASNSAVLATAQAAIATDKADSILGLQAQASTLVAGSSATASYNSVSGMMTFGIPQGTKGDKGDSYNPNAVGLYSQIGLYDTQIQGFSFLAIDQSMIYFKLSNTSGDWSAGVLFGKGDTGATGATGNGILSITLLSTVGNVDTYRITMTDTTTFDYTVTNANIDDSTTSLTKTWSSSKISTFSVPTIQTNAATSIAGASIVANGEITNFKNGCNPETTQVRFSYGTDTDATNIGTTSWVSKSDLTAFSATISGLSPATTYYFKAQLQDTTYPSLNGTGIVTGDIESVLTASESIGTTINITGASTGGGFTALNATSYPTLTNASIVSNIIVASADGATATTYEFNQANTSEVTPTVDLTPRTLTVGGTAGVPVFTSSVGGLFTTGDTVYIDDGVSVKAAVCGTVTQTGGTLLSLAGSITNPYGITTDGTDLYVAITITSGNNSILKITTAGSVTTFATLPAVSGTARGLCRDSSGNFYVSRGDVIYKITSAGTVTTFYTSAGADYYGLKIGLDGNIYAADSSGGKVIKITPAGSATDFIASVASITDLAQDASGNWYLTLSGSGNIYKYNSAGAYVGVRNISIGAISLFITSDNLYATGASSIIRVSGVRGITWTGGTAVTETVLVTGLSTAKSSVLLNNTLYITETGASRVSKYTLDYTYSIAGTTPVLTAPAVWAGVDEQTLEFGIGATSGSEVYTTMVNPTITRATNKLTLSYPAHDTSGNFFKFRHAALNNTDAISRLYATTKYI